MGKETRFITLIAIGTSILVALGGVYLQYDSDESTALVRAGSIIVCIGVLNIFLGLRFSFIKIDKNYADLEYPNGLIDIEESLIPKVDRAKNRTEQARLSVNNLDAILDMAILVSGTLLSGFGDLLV